MIVPDEIRKCVVFLLYKTNEGEKLAGTGFFASVQLEEGKHLSYLITAKHIIDCIKKRSIDQKIIIRINLTAGGTESITTPIEKWRFHPTEETSVDVAVLAYSLPQSKYDYLSIPISMAATDEILKDQTIGIGDEVFLAGLFYRHHGKQKNLPILRAGNIAMMPAEKIHTEFGDIDAYLVESRSIGGLSGSPVFVYLGPMRPKNGSLNVGGNPLFYWLGLMHGHWNLNSDKVDFILDRTQEQELNTGIAAVVPVTKILEVVNRSEFVEARNKLYIQIKKQNAT